MIREDYTYHSTAFQADELKAKKNANGDLVVFNNTVSDKNIALMSKENIEHYIKWLRFAFEEKE